MKSEIILSAEDTCKQLINANIRVNDAKKRLINLGNSNKRQSEINKILIIESNYIKRIILESIKENATYHAENKEVMNLWNILERSLLEFQKVYDKVGKIK